MPKLTEEKLLEFTAKLNKELDKKSFCGHTNCPSCAHLRGYNEALRSMIKLIEEEK